MTAVNVKPSAHTVLLSLFSPSECAVRTNNCVHFCPSRQEAKNRSTMWHKRIFNERKL
uniref:Uncharacterized protein n=1 Tax=Anguilla anguilla TaxID=7936 RepID=A0A0E9S500_ANGAN